MKTELVKRKISNLKPDPDQPRKKFDKEAINNLAQTMKTQGIINPIEIDENDTIITGEMRWRAAKIAFKNGELFDCKLLTELEPIERFERQTIENIHHNTLKDTELKEAINKLWSSKKYNTQIKLAKRIGLSPQYVSGFIKIPEIEKILGSSTAGKLRTTTLMDIERDVKSVVDKKKIAQKAVEENLTRDQVREIIKETKKLPEEIKKEVLKPKSKITIANAKEVAKLTPEVRKEVLKPKPKITLEEAKEVDKMPEDIKKEILKPTSELTVKDAKMIADIPKPEIRKEAIKHIKQEKKQHENTMKYIEDVAKGKTPPPKKIINIDQKAINQFNDIRKQVVMKMSKRHVETYNENTKTILYKIMKETLEFLQKELNIKGDIINV